MTFTTSIFSPIYRSLTVLIALLAALIGVFSSVFTFLFFSTFYSATPEFLQTMDMQKGQELIASIGEFSFQFAILSLYVVVGVRLFRNKKRRNSTLSNGASE